MTDPTSSDVFTDTFDAWALHYDSFYEPGSRRDLEFRLSRKLMTTSRRWVNLVDGLVKARTGHSRARWQTMFAIDFSEPPLTTIALASRLGVQWPTLVRVLDDLDADGMITRIDNPDDRRSRWIELSAKGKRTVREVQAILDPARADIVSGLSDEEIAVCMGLLDRILRRTGTWRAAHARTAADDA